MYKIIFYAPPSHTEAIKNAMFTAGAGKLGNYCACAWQVLGEGQFMPKAGSHAFIGTQDKLEKLPEYRVEMVCEDNYIHAVVSALKKSHPYEVPAYQVIKVEDM